MMRTVYIFGYCSLLQNELCARNSHHNVEVAKVAAIKSR